MRDEPRESGDLLAAAFHKIDPARTDPTYWERFSRVVLTRALPELSRRGCDLPLSLSDVVSSWARTLLPTAAAAAAIGIFLISRSPVPDSEIGQASVLGPVIGVEELLISEIEGDPIPALLASDLNERVVGAVTFASDAF